MGPRALVMNIWQEPKNIFAPLIAAVPADIEWAGFGNALIVVGESVPVTSIVYNVKRRNSFRRVREVRHRIVYTVVGDAAKPFSARIGCLDKPVDAPGKPLVDEYWQLA